MKISRRDITCAVALTSLTVLGVSITPYLKRVEARTQATATAKANIATTTPIPTATIVPTAKPVATATVKPPTATVKPTAIPTATSTPKPTATPYQKTEDGITKLHNTAGGGIFIATSDAAWDALGKAAVADDELGIELLINSGAVLIIPNDTRVTILKRGFESTQVRILEGRHRGVAGWTMKQFVFNDPLIR